MSSWRKISNWPHDKGSDSEAVSEDLQQSLNDSDQGSLKNRTPALALRDSGGSLNGLRPLLDADTGAADKDRREPLLHAVRARPTPISKGFVEYTGSFVWKGLETYKKCDGAMSDILTISGSTSSNDHCYMAKSVLEFLTEYYPAFGLDILNWITEICKRCQELETTTSLQDSAGTRSNMSQEVVEMNATYAIIKGYLEAGTLIWAISTNSEELASDMKSALSWALSALQSQPQDAVGLFSWSPVSLDFGLPEKTMFNPTKAESYCWINLFSYADIAPLPSLNFKDRPATEGLEIDFALLLELAAVDREISTEDGLILFGFDTALVSLDPPESRRWHFLVTNGIQITPARVKKELGKGTENQEGLKIRFRGKIEHHHCNGKVYVGWCAAPVIEFGTTDSDRASVDHISRPFGVYNIKKNEESVEKSPGDDESSFFRTGDFGSRIGASSEKENAKIFQQANVVAKRTRKSSFWRVSLHQHEEIAFEIKSRITG